MNLSALRSSSVRPIASALALAAASVPMVASGIDAATELPFAEFYRRPVGPRGLEPGPRLLALAGARVQLSGFIVHSELPTRAPIIAALPVSVGDEDEGLADDLPAAVAYLHPVDARVAAAIVACRRAMQVTGRLELGALAEADGRTSFVRLRADDVRCAR